VTFFPQLQLWQIRYVARSRGCLPPLVTAAVHGGVGQALYHAVCLARARASCRGCPAEPTCPYPTLFDPPAPSDPALRQLGVTNEAPRPFAISPERPFVPVGPHWFTVEPGDALLLRLVVTPEVQSVWRDLWRALVRAGRKGFGERRERVCCDLDAVEPLDPADPAPATYARLEFLTPVRLKSDGRIASELSPELLFEAIVRRAALWAALQRCAWSPPAAWREQSRSLRMRAHLRLLRVRRFSSTQRRLLEWPGLIGSIELEGEELPNLWPLLCFGAKAQIGKATTFGFGRFRLLNERSASELHSEEKHS